MSGGINVRNSKDDGSRPKPFATLEIPIRRTAEHEMSLREEMASGSYGDTKIELHRTFDGALWVYVDGVPYVMEFRDIILQTLEAVEREERDAVEMDVVKE